MENTLQNMKHQTAPDNIWPEALRGGAHTYVEGDGFLSDASMSNLTELLGIGKHQGLSDMMRMSGVDEAYISGEASDYDKLEAMLRVIPLWLDHPYINAIQAVISRLTGKVYPLTLGSLPEIWQTAAGSMRETRLTARDLLCLWGIDRMTCLLTPAQLEKLTPNEASREGISVCLYIPHTACDVLWGRDVMHPITSSTAQDDVTARLKAYLDTLAERGCTGVAVSLADEPHFIKPNPYTPAQAIARLQRGERLEEYEKSLVAFQTVRMLGGECLRRGWTMTLLYLQPQVSTALISYLRSCHCLPTLVTVSDVPTVDALRSGEYVYPIPICTHEETVARMLCNLATRMPIGCLGGVFAPVQGAIDLPLWMRMKEALCSQTPKE